MGENPKGLSAPSQFHHKYPDRASGAELIVQAPAAALPETALPAVGGRRPRQETPPDVPQGPGPGTGLVPWTRRGAILKLGWTLALWLGIWGLVCYLPA